MGGLKGSFVIHAPWSWQRSKTTGTGRHQGGTSTRKRCERRWIQRRPTGPVYARFVVALTESSVAMRDGVLERAIPGQELGMTLRVLAMVHGVCIPPRTSPRFPTKLNQQLGSPKPLQSAVHSKERPIGLAEVPVLGDETHWRSC